ncbi:MAG: LysE family translocator [Kiloniellales bacterium]
MPIELWFAFVVASTILVTIPGPTVLLVVSYAMGAGRKSGWATVPGVALGDLTAMTVSLAGAGAVLATSATLFTILKLAGAAYLVWLGIRLWRADPAPEALAARAKPKGFLAMFASSYVVTALNPKGIVFFIAFVPQFVLTDRPLLPQFAVLVATFVTIAAVNVALWAILAGEMRARFRRPGVLRLINRVGGSLLIGAGALTALARRTG